MPRPGLGVGFKIEAFYAGKTTDLGRLAASCMTECDGVRDDFQAWTCGAVAKKQDSHGSQRG